MSLLDLEGAVLPGNGTEALARLIGLAGPFGGYWDGPSWAIRLRQLLHAAFESDGSSEQNILQRVQKAMQFKAKGNTDAEVIQVQEYRADWA